MPGGRTLGHIAAKCKGPVSWPQAGERAYPAKKQGRWLRHFICVCNPEIFVEVGLKMDFPYQAAGEAFGAQMLYVPVDKRCDPSTTHTPRSTTHRPTPICPLQHPPSRLHQQMHLLTKLPLRKWPCQNSLAGLVGQYYFTLGYEPSRCSDSALDIKYTWKNHVPPPRKKQRKKIRQIKKTPWE